MIASFKSKQDATAALYDAAKLILELNTYFASSLKAGTKDELASLLIAINDQRQVFSDWAG